MAEYWQEKRLTPKHVTFTWASRRSRGPGRGEAWRQAQGGARNRLAGAELFLLSRRRPLRRYSAAPGLPSLGREIFGPWRTTPAGAFFLPGRNSLCRVRSGQFMPATEGRGSVWEELSSASS